MLFRSRRCRGASLSLESGEAGRIHRQSVPPSPRFGSVWLSIPCRRSSTPLTKIPGARQLARLVVLARMTRKSIFVRASGLGNSLSMRTPLHLKDLTTKRRWNTKNGLSMLLFGQMLPSLEHRSPPTCLLHFLISLPVMLAAFLLSLLISRSRNQGFSFSI